MKTVLRWLLLALCVYLLLNLMLAALQRQLIYFPSTAPEDQLLAASRQLGLKPLRIENEIVAWQSPLTPGTRRRLLVFHGNAGFALHRAHFLALPQKPAEWQVILAEYPGYGSRSSRSPGEAEFRQSADALLSQLQRDNDLPIFVVGESIGSGVAAWLAETHPDAVAGLLLITPMTSLPDVAAVHYPWLPVRWLLRDRFDAVAALAKYHGPVAFLIAGRDDIIPPAIGRRLHDSYEGPKLLIEQPGAGHNSVDFTPAVWEPIFDFLHEHAGR